MGSLLSGIRKKVRLYFFHREMGRRSRHKEVMGLDESRSLAILFDASEPMHHSQVVTLVARLRDEGKKVRCLGFVRQKKKPDFIVDQIHFAFCQPADFSWNLRLRSPSLQEFAGLEPDILMDLTPPDLFLMKLVAGMIPARYKVGVYDPELVEIYDLMIRESPGVEPGILADHCLQYLKILKKPLSHA
jgi:hypothetical protein